MTDEPGLRTEDSGLRNPTQSSALSPQSSAGVPWASLLRSLITSIEASDVRELEVATTGLRIFVRRALQTPSGVRPTAAPSATAGDTPEEAGLHAIRCPLTGVWYDVPSPGAPPFVRVGDLIGVGTVIGLLETMKVFNEVHSDAVGIVRQILVHKGDLVLAHAPLATLELASAPLPMGIGDLA